MHARQRDQRILDMVAQRGFVAFRDLDASLEASPATVRRDLGRLAAAGRLIRVRGGVAAVDGEKLVEAATHMAGVPFHENASLHTAEKQAIGRAAAALCAPGEAVMIDGGSTTLQMCAHLADLNLQVLTNSLHIVSALLPQAGTRILVPGGTVFREQNVILSALNDESIPRFHAPKLFMGAAALGPQGLMQADVILVAVERRLIDRADEVVVLVDSSKFTGPSGHVVCSLEDIDVVVTDEKVTDAHAAAIEAAGVRLIRAPALSAS